MAGEKPHRLRRSNQRISRESKLGRPRTIFFSSAASLVREKWVRFFRFRAGERFISRVGLVWVRADFRGEKIR